jgi:hypothetical protein
VSGKTIKILGNKNNKKAKTRGRDFSRRNNPMVRKGNVTHESIKPIKNKGLENKTLTIKKHKEHNKYKPTAAFLPKSAAVCAVVYTEKGIKLVSKLILFKKNEKT